MRKRTVAFVVAAMVLGMVSGFSGISMADEIQDKKAVSQKPDPAKTRVLKLLKNQSSNDGIKQAQAYLENNPDDADVLSILGEAYINKNNLAAAESAVKKALAQQPDNAYANRVLAKIYMLKAEKDQANMNAALEQLKKAAAVNSGDAAIAADQRSIYVAQAKMYMAKNELAEANAALDAAIALSDAKEKKELLAMKESINKPAQPKPQE